MSGGVMLKLFVLVALLPVTQWIADAMGGAAPQGARWLWAWSTHYVLCFALLVFSDHAPWQQTASRAVALMWIVRTFYFFKRAGAPKP
jgi:hypothetical protein